MKRKRLGAPSRAMVLARDRREPTHVAFSSSRIRGRTMAVAVGGAGGGGGRGAQR
jgi:hypothetical protein